MAATITLLGSLFDTNSGTHTVTATPALGDLIVIVVANTGNTAAVAPTDNNTDTFGTYVVGPTALKNTSADQLLIFVRTSVVRSATSTVFTQAAGVSSGGGLAVYKVTGMTKSGALSIVQSALQSNQAAAGTPAPAFTNTPGIGNPIITAVFNATNPGAVTARGTPAYTRDVNGGYITPTTGIDTAHINFGETSATITWGSTSATAFCSVAIELDITQTPLHLYIQDAAPTFTETLNGTWNDTTNAANVGGLFTNPSGAAATLAIAAATATNPWDVLLASWNGILLNAQTIQGTVRYIFGVQTSGASPPFTTKLHIWVSVGSTSSVRGVLLNNFIGTTTWPTTAQGITDGLIQLQPVNALANDCIIIEVGYRKTTATATSTTGTINYGSSAASPDLTNGDTSVTVHPGWIEFSQLIQIGENLGATINQPINFNTIINI